MDSSFYCCSFKVCSFISLFSYSADFVALSFVTYGVNVVALSLLDRIRATSLD